MRILGIHCRSSSSKFCGIIIHFVCTYHITSVCVREKRDAELIDYAHAMIGINVDATDRRGRTPLHCAAQVGS